MDNGMGGNQKDQGGGRLPGHVFRIAKALGRVI